MSILRRCPAREAFRGLALTLMLALMPGSFASALRAEPVPLAASLGLGQAQAVSLSGMAKWTGVLARSWAQQPVAGRFCAQRLGEDCHLGEWRAFLERLRPLSAARQMEQVNAYINRVRYRSDQRAWGRSDYWAAPGEFFARGGDCEDYAIAKFLSLKRLGFDPEAMRVLVVQDERRNRVHAVLVVRYQGATLVLDNQAAGLRSWHKISGYRPLLSVSETSFWLHSRKRPT